MNTNRSQAQIDASRTNGALSHGPVTDEGKAISSRNSVRHGILSNSILLIGESREEFDRLLTSQIQEFDPQTDAEMGRVEELVVCRWRQMQIWCMIAARINEGIEEQPGRMPGVENRLMAARTFDAFDELNVKTGSLNALHRYEARYSRVCNRLYKELTELKKKRYAGA